MEDFMSENNSGAGVQQQDNRNSEQNKEKRQRFDPSKQDAGKSRGRNQGHRRRNNGQRQGGYDKRRDNGENQGEGNKPRERNFNRDRQGGRDQNKQKRDQNRDQNREQNQGNDKRNQPFGQSPAPKKSKRQRELGEEVAKNVKKVETIEDIRSDNARITKEIYLEIASLKNINLN